MYLVIAAGAPVGRAIAEQLLAQGRPVRTISRDPATADLPAGVEVIAGDLADPDTLAVAMDGVTAAFLLAVVPGFAPAFVAAAQDAGVRRVAFQSSGAIDTAPADEVAAFHAEIEESLRASRLGWTMLRLAVASSDALHWAFDLPGQLAAGDVVRGPAADAAVSPLHPADLAAVAVAAMVGDAHEGATYTLTGPESVTVAEQIATLAVALGRPLRYVELDPHEARAAMSPYAPADLLLSTWERHRHQPAPVTDTVLVVTGSKPRGLAEYATHLAAAA